MSFEMKIEYFRAKPKLNIQLPLFIIWIYIEFITFMYENMKLKTRENEKENCILYNSSGLSVLCVLDNRQDEGCKLRE